VNPGAFTVDRLPVRVLPDGDTLARAAADDAAATVRDAIARRGVANVMFASGKSQLGLLAALAAAPALDWQRVVGFHLDEYAGLGGRHRASLRRYMRELVAGPLGIGAFHYLDEAAADFDDPLDVKVASLDGASRRQQVGEGLYLDRESASLLGRAA
jgi:glucosamine-6-phosphate deaminase